MAITEIKLAITIDLAAVDGLSGYFGSWNSLFLKIVT